MVSNIKIVTTGGRQIDYEKSEDISIKMNRIADDLQDIESRYGEFSYSFSVPKTRNNVQIFEYAGVPHVKGIFKINPIDVQVFNNDLLILTGQLELQEITIDKYKCVFYSKLTQLIDDLKDKNMQDLTNCPQIDWNYEATIRTHINANYLSCDETDYQFPFIFYNTFYCPTSVFTGLTDTIVDSNGTTAHAFNRERDWQNWYYYINHSSIGENNTWYQWFPLAFYLKPMMEYMLAEIGWTMAGSFWEDANVKKIIMPYVGDNPWDSAVYCDNGGNISGCTGDLKLNTARFMPDMECTDFLENVVKLFNLYLIINTNNKIITFETYDVMFGHKVAPYNINNKIIETPVMARVDDYNPSVHFDDIDNQRILGDNRYIASSGTNAYTNTNYLITKNNTLFNEVFNYIGSTDGSIKVDFGAPAVKRMRIRNSYNYSDVNKSTDDHVFFIPFISKQLPEDNASKPFSKKDSDSTAFNNESSVQYKGKPVLLYYFGISSSDIVQKATKGSQSDFFYINLASTNQKIPFTSPFALTAYRQVINQTLYDAGLNPTGSTNDAVVMLAGYMQSIYLMMADSTGLTSNVTDMSLILANNNDFGETIYTKYHSNKYKRYQNSDTLSMKIICTDVDWNALQINTPVFYNNQIYSILAIKNYDVVKQTAQLDLIKQL